jgi:NAD-dependent oxidoreductase involved in siderophore biosynthesis
LQPDVRGDFMIRVGLVGFGLAGSVFHAPLISSVEGLELAAVLERNSDHAAERYPGITTYRSLETMLADASLGLFVVATPNGTHFEIARQILEAGKSVIVDKPTAITSAEIFRHFINLYVKIWWAALFTWNPPSTAGNRCHEPAPGKKILPRGACCWILGPILPTRP